MTIFNPHVFSSVYNALVAGTPVLNEALSLYGKLPQMKYERQKKEEEAKQRQELANRQMALEEQRVQASVLDTHIDNALKVLKYTNNPNVALTYLDKYVPGHGLSFEGYIVPGVARIAAPDGSKADFMGGTPVWGPEGLLDPETYALTPKGTQLWMTGDKNTRRQIGDLWKLVQSGALQPPKVSEGKGEDKQGQGGQPLAPPVGAPEGYVQRPAATPQPKGSERPRGRTAAEVNKRVTRLNPPAFGQSAPRTPPPVAPPVDTTYGLPPGGSYRYPVK